MIAPIILAVLAVVLFFWALASVAGILFWLVPWVLLGLIAGWVASRIVGGPQGLLGDVVVGIAGSIIGGVLFSLFNIHTYGVLSIQHVLVSIVGALILLVGMRAFGRSSVI